VSTSRATLPAARGIRPVWAVAATGALVGAALVGLLVGPVPLDVTEILRSAAARLPFVPVETPLAPPQEAIVWELRVPRVVLGALVGAVLATAGAAYQGAFRNPLADPYLLGVAAGAGLGATLAIAYGPGGLGSSRLLPLAAFAGATVGVAAAYALGRSAGDGRGPATLILAGVTVAAFLTAAQTFVLQQRSDTLQEVYSWLLGGLDTAGWRDVLVVLPYGAVSVGTILAHRRSLDALSVGDEEAASLGLDVTRVRLVIVVAATIGTAAAVAISGLIGFVGIIVPHAIRLGVAASYRVIVPLSIVVGAVFLVLADVLARTVVAPAELPIGIVTAFCGAPFFALVLRTTTRTVGP
jgi:iron complex transport system permease protein